jgi:hypothetical protein
VWERGKWAVYEEGGDRAIMGGGSVFSLLFSFLMVAGEGSVSLVALL